MKSLNTFNKQELLSVSTFLYNKIGFGTGSLKNLSYHTLRSKAVYAKNLAIKRGKIAKTTWMKLLRSAS